MLKRIAQGFQGAIEVGHIDLTSPQIMDFHHRCYPENCFCFASVSLFLEEVEWCKYTEELRKLKRLIVLHDLGPMEKLIVITMS